MTAERPAPALEAYARQVLEEYEWLLSQTPPEEDRALGQRHAALKSVLSHFELIQRLQAKTPPIGDEASRPAVEFLLRQARSDVIKL